LSTAVAVKFYQKVTLLSAAVMQRLVSFVTLYTMAFRLFLDSYFFKLFSMKKIFFLLALCFAVCSYSVGQTAAAAPHSAAVTQPGPGKQRYDKHKHKHKHKHMKHRKRHK
jgi:hypothetical protein